MNTKLFTTTLAILSLSNAALAAEALTLPVPPVQVLEMEALESPDAALDALTTEAEWDTMEEELAADRLVIVAAAVGDAIVLEPGFKVANVEISDLWIADADVTRRGETVVLYPTNVGTTRLVTADAEGWVLEYEIRVEAGEEDPELAEYVVEETDDARVAEAPAAGDSVN